MTDWGDEYICVDCGETVAVGEDSWEWADEEETKARCFECLIKQRDYYKEAEGIASGAFAEEHAKVGRLEGERNVLFSAIEDAAHFLSVEDVSKARLVLKSAVVSMTAGEVVKLNVTAKPGAKYSDIRQRIYTSIVEGVAGMDGVDARDYANRVMETFFEKHPAFLGLGAAELYTAFCNWWEKEGKDIPVDKETP